jgi:predicted acetyltransferase
VGDAELTVKNVETDEEIAGYLLGMSTSFLSKRDVSPEWIAYCRKHWDFSRTWMALDGDTQCGTTRTFPSRLRLPGLGDAPVSCLTQVTVLPTHTRRGHVTRLMRAQLEQAVDAGEVASLLIAAEWPIYGRFGYGPATEWVEWQVDVTHAQVVGEPVGSCELVDVAAYDEAAATVLERQQRHLPGCIVRPDWLRHRLSGLDPSPVDEGDKTRVWLVHRDASGEPDGVVMYDVKEKWQGMRPECRVNVKDMAFASPVAERELWRYLLTVDLVGLVTWEGWAGSSIRHVLANGRGARSAGRWDQLWARILDVPAALEARAYSHRGRVVVEVTDPFMGRGGRFALDASPDGASCTSTSESAEVTLPISALSAAWLGGTDPAVMAAGGAIDEHAPGSVDRLAALLSWHQTPWSHTDF